MALELRLARVVEEINERVVYSHPEFEDEADQELYDSAAYALAFMKVLETL